MAGLVFQKSVSHLGIPYGSSSALTIDTGNLLEITQTIGASTSVQFACTITSSKLVSQFFAIDNNSLATADNNAYFLSAGNSTKTISPSLPYSWTIYDGVANPNAVNITTGTLINASTTSVIVNGFFQYSN